MKVQVYYWTGIELEIEAETYEEAAQLATDKATGDDKSYKHLCDNLEFEEVCIVSEDGELLYSQTI